MNDSGIMTWGQCFHGNKETCWCGELRQNAHTHTHTHTHTHSVSLRTLYSSCCFGLALDLSRTALIDSPNQQNAQKTNRQPGNQTHTHTHTNLQYKQSG